jgi:hypothetical protein
LVFDWERGALYRVVFQTQSGKTCFSQLVLDCDRAVPSPVKTVLAATCADSSRSVLVAPHPRMPLATESQLTYFLRNGEPNTQ